MISENNEASGFTPIDENRFLRTILDAAPAMIAYWDRNLHCRYANQAYLEWFGTAPEKVIGMLMTELLGERLFKLNEQFIRGALDGKRQCFERTLTKADGSTGYTLANYMPNFDDTGAVAGFSVMVSDVTSLKLAEFQTERAQARLQAVLDSVTDCIITIEENWTITSINSAGLRMFGYQPDQLIGRDLQLLIPKLHDGADRSDAGARDLAVPSRARSETQELTGLSSDGHSLPIELRITRVKTHGDSLHVAVIHDITLQRQVQEQLIRLALTDGLTGLANRRHFDDVLSLALNTHIRSGGQLSLILIDVDFFKQFNDQYGHSAGDDCLRQIASTIKRVITRSIDLAARYGGEEFACILPMTDQTGALGIARQIQDEIGRLGIKHGRSSVAKHVTVSIGIATTYCTNELSAEDIIKLADMQLYMAKQNGRNQISATQLAHGTATRAPTNLGQD